MPDRDSHCSKCGGDVIRSGYGVEVSDGKTEHFACDLELVRCAACGANWFEVIKECRQWRRESRKAGRDVPYYFGSA